MTYTAYRVQNQNRNVADLLDADNQFSRTIHLDDETTRVGVSACETLAELAAYWATGGVEIDGTPALVKVTGPLSGDTGLDADRGEILVLPETAETVEDDDLFFEVVGDLWELAFEGYDFDDLVEAAEERF